MLRSTSSIREISCPNLSFKLLRGIVCVYKPPDFHPKKIESLLRENLVRDLNELDRIEKFRKLFEESPEWQKVSKLTHKWWKAGKHVDKELLAKVLSPTSTLASDYSSHPLVIGEGFDVKRDLALCPVNKLEYRMSGLSLFVLRNFSLRNQIVSARMPRTYRVRLEFGRSTDTGFIDGKFIEKSTNPYLKEKKLQNALAAIQGSHLRETFKYAHVSLQSQEAYEMASKGPVRPAEHAGPLIYNLKCVEMEQPFVELELTVINETEDFIIELCTELGLRLKTNAVCHKIRCVRYGIFNLDHCLLFKHVNLENTLNNIFTNKALFEANYENLFKKHFQDPLLMEKEIEE